MICENYFCIYWVNNSCSLKDISLDICGTCLQCIYVNIDEDLLRQERNNHLSFIKKTVDNLLEKDLSEVKFIDKSILAALLRTNKKICKK